MVPILPFFRMGVVILILALSSSNAAAVITDTSNIIVREGVGFGDIILGNRRCTKEFIKSKLGPPDKEIKHWISYQSTTGLDFLMANRGDLLIEIRLNRGFRGKLSTNISLSSLMDDVFSVYGRPVAEEFVDNIQPCFDNRKLYRQGNIGKLFYNEYGLLFWFSGNRITQIVVFRTGPGAPPLPKPLQIKPRVAIKPQEVIKPLEAKVVTTFDVPIDRRYPRWGPLVRINRLWDFVKMLWVYWYYTLAALVTLGFLLKDSIRKLYYRWRPLPEGRLLIVKGPTRAEKSNINIWYQARLLRKRRLTVGSGEGVDIRLSHKSVEPLHARVCARRFEGHVVTYIERLGGGKVAVNDVCERIMPLADNADVRIGAFRFQYERPTEYRQVQVRYRNGRVVEGVPTSWDINSAGFTLIPSRAASWVEAVFIRFEKLRGVYFMQDWDEDVRNNLLKGGRQLRKHPATICFRDDEELPGYLIGDYQEQARRFYFFPKDQSGETVYILVERRGVKSVEQMQEAQ